MQTSGYRYGCLFVKTGRESEIVDQINDAHLGISAIFVKHIKFYKVDRKRIERSLPTFPGYVFLRSEREICPPQDFKNIRHIIKLLHSSDGNWELGTGDRELVTGFFENGALLGISKAYREGDTVKIIEGPLKDYGGQIIAIDKHRKNGLISFDLNKNSFKIWLPFEYIDNI